MYHVSFHVFSYKSPVSYSMFLAQWWQCSNGYTCSTSHSSQTVRNCKPGARKPKLNRQLTRWAATEDTQHDEAGPLASFGKNSVTIPSHTQHKLSLLQMLIYRENYQVESEQCECYMDLNDSHCTVSALRCFWQSNKMTSQYDQNESSKHILILVFFL